MRCGRSSPSASLRAKRSARRGRIASRRPDRRARTGSGHGCIEIYRIVQTQWSAVCIAGGRVFSLCRSKMQRSEKEEHIFFFPAHAGTSGPRPAYGPFSRARVRPPLRRVNGEAHATESAQTRRVPIWLYACYLPRHDSTSQRRLESPAWLARSKGIAQRSRQRVREQQLRQHGGRKKHISVRCGQAVVCH